MIHLNDSKNQTDNGARLLEEFLSVNGERTRYDVSVKPTDAPRSINKYMSSKY